jgi:hypothetical protein
MAFDNRRTYICYNNRDLIRDGYIPKFIRKSYREDNSLTKPVTTFNFRRLRNPPKGVTYTVVRNPPGSDVIVEVIERKKLLPAEKIMIEIEFSKTMKNAVSHPIPVTPIAPGAVGGLVGNVGMQAIGFGGFTHGWTQMTYHLLESSTFINKKIEVTQEMLDTGILQFDGFPLSVFGIVKEYKEVFEGGEEEANEFKQEHPQARISVDPVLEKYVATIGLDFTSGNDYNQLDVLGRFSSGSFLGTGRKRIDGATDSNGLYGGRANAWLRLVENLGDSGFDISESEKREVVLFEGQDQLFEKIVNDDRTLKFRADNFDAWGGGVYPFQIRGKDGIDVTDKQIRIDVSNLVVGDILYATYNATVGDRHLRQNVEHKGTIGQGNTVGIVGFQAAIASEQDIFDYKLRTWMVPPLPTGITMPIIDQVTDGYTSEEDYKLTLNEFITIDEERRQVEENGQEFILPVDRASEIEGWRLAEAILWRRIDNLFAADYRGIFYMEGRGNQIQMIYPRSLIRDQEWFTSYLESLPFTYPTGPPDPSDPVDEYGNPKPTYLPTDLEVKLESSTNFADMEGFLFDSAEIVNSLLFDREKMHYYRPFADALKEVSQYVASEPNAGIGLPHLDLLPLLCPSVTFRTETETNSKGEPVTYKFYNYSNFDPTTCAVINLEYYDLSYSVFDNTHAQFAKGRSCEDPFPLRHYNYFSTNRDADSDGQGIWYDRGYIENSVMEWRPEGGILNSYWKLETPYFCGDFNGSTRVYIEKMGGKSLDNYSWIYVDTEPFVPENISLDSNYDASTSLLVFYDDVMHECLNYHKINDNMFEQHQALINIDKTKNHIRDTYDHIVNGDDVVEFFDHDKNFITGQNRLIGDWPSYSYGIPITEDVFRICNTVCEPDSSESFDFWFTRDLFNDTWDDGTSFDLDFSEKPPRANIPHNWLVKYIEIEFSYDPSVVVENIEKYVSFYFEDSESSVSNFSIIEMNPTGPNSFIVRFFLKYYFGGPFQFLGKFWEKVNILKVEARFAKGNDSGIEEKLNLDTYKIKYGQNAVAYDRNGRMMVFYANEETSNIDIAVSYDDGETWAYDRNIFRLLSGETATLPFVMKDTNSRIVHLFWVLNDKFLMYRRVDTQNIDITNGLVDPRIPDTYEAGDYDLSLDDPEREYWGDYSFQGVLLRREPSYFIVGNSDDEYYLEQIQINTGIADSNNSLAGTSDANKIQTVRFVAASKDSEMRADFNGLPYSVYLSNDGVLRLFFISNGRMSIKSSYNYITWQYDVFEQSIHKNYMDDNLNKGFSENITNIQIVRDDYDKSIVSVLYVYSGMLFIRHFYSALLFPWRDTDGNLHDDQMRRHLEVTDEDTTVDPPKSRTTNNPIFLVGVIPEKIRNSIKRDIDNDVARIDSDLAIYFPYEDPDDHTGLTDLEVKELNKKMVDIFNQNTTVSLRVTNANGDWVDTSGNEFYETVETDFSFDGNTQPYGYVTARGMIRVFYKDDFGNINGIIIDALENPNLEVMNVFNGVK